MLEPALPQPDLFLAAIGRSGSTMFANLLSTPPDRWLIVEPRFADATTGRDVLDQARAAGMAIDDGQWELLPGESRQARNVRVFGARLAGLQRWGLKEVRPGILLPTLQTLRPKRTIVLVRDLRDVAVSLFEKVARDANARYDADWLRGYLTEAPTGVLAVAAAVAGQDHRVVRYEDLVAGSRLREELAAWLDWPLDGRPDRNLATVFRREHEVALHGGEITERSVGRHGAATASADARAIAAWAHEHGRAYQQRFGYA